MKKRYLLGSALFIGISLSAQNVKLTAGQKFNVTQTTKMTTKASAMGQEMEIGNSIINSADYEIKSITGSGFILTATVKHIKGSVSVMGTDQSFDSDDEASKSNPEMAKAFDMLNKPYDIEIDKDHNTTVQKGDMADKMSQMGLPAGISNELAKFVLSQAEIAKLKTGSQWKDSVITDDSKVVNEYSVIKVDDATAEVFVKTTSKMNVTMKQMGMEMKEALNGTYNAKRQYNKVTGLMIREDNDLVIDGTINVMGQDSPMSIKGTTVTVVN